MMKKTNLGLLIILIVISVSILVILQSFSSEIQENDHSGIINMNVTSLSSSSISSEGMQTVGNKK